VVSYLRTLPRPKLLLWCYLLWYVYFTARLFDPSPSLWFNSVGLSLLIGTALYVSTAYAGAGNVSRRSGQLSGGFSRRVPVDGWVVFRCYLMPFCVSSFAALIKGKGFVLVFSPDLRDNVIGLGLCSAFVSTAEVVKRAGQRLVPEAAPPAS
jgi:hypothetical protein